MMIYTAAMDTFYLTDEQLTDTPSRKDGIDDATETTLRIYGCDLIQESGILLRLPQAVMTTGQVLFHRFYCKQSFARFDVKRVAASCVWLASKLEESPRRARHVLNVFRKMECRRENLPVAHLDVFSKKYAEIKMDDLITTERCILKEMGFICHVEHPHKFISNYLATLEAPPELRQEAWNLANDSLRTTLCVRFKSEIVACGVVYAAARRFKVPLPENPPWWKAFGAKKYSIHEVCRVLAHLYSLPKAQYIPVCKDGGSFTTSNRFWDSPTQPIPLSVASTSADPNTIMVSSADFCVPKDAILKVALGQSKKSNEALQSVFIEKGEIREENLPRSKSKSENRTDVSEERIRDREREKEKERLKVHDRKRRDSDREWEQELFGRDRGKVKDRGGQSKEKGKDSGHLEKTKHCSSRDPDYHGSSYSSSREKDRRMYHSYG